MQVKVDGASVDRELLAGVSGCATPGYVFLRESAVNIVVAVLTLPPVVQHNDCVDGRIWSGEVYADGRDLWSQDWWQADWRYLGERPPEAPAGVRSRHGVRAGCNCVGGLPPVCSSWCTRVCVCVCVCVWRVKCVLCMCVVCMCVCCVCESGRAGGEAGGVQEKQEPNI